MLTLAALLLHVLPPALVAAPDGGSQVGIGGRSWQVARKAESDAGFGPPLFSSDGGFFFADGLRQGCDVQGCAFIAPGLFVARGIDARSPTVGIRLESVGRDNFDLRVGFVEAQADGGLACLALLTDASPLADLYSGGWGCDGIAAHLTVDVGQSTLNQLTLSPASGGLREELRTDFSARAGGLTVTEGIPVALSWSLLPVTANKTQFAVTIGAKQFAVNLDDAELNAPPNTDAVNFEGGRLDTSRLVPVLFIGWGGFHTTADTTSMTFSLEGRGLDVTPTQTGALTFELDVQSVDALGVAVASGDTVTAQLEGAALSDVTLDGGAGHLSVTLPSAGAFTLELQSQQDQWVRGHAVLLGTNSFDAGLPDAGLPDAGLLDAGLLDAGLPDAGPPDAGAGVDAGEVGDAGAVRRTLAVGCGCSTLDPSLALVALLALARRVRA